MAGIIAVLLGSAAVHFGGVEAVEALIGGVAVLAMEQFVTAQPQKKWLSSVH